MQVTGVIRRSASADGAGYPLLAGAGVLNCLYAAVAAYHRPWTSSTYDITVAWAVGLTLFVVAGCAGRSPRRLAGRLARAAADSGRNLVVDRTLPAWSTVAGCTIGGVALVSRLVALDRFPSPFDSDEGFFLLEARLARDGELPNPYGVGLWGMPRAYVAWQGIVSRPFADSYASYRLLGAVLGAATVLLVWRGGRRLVGEGAALAGAGLLALLPFHLWASRSGLNNSVNAFSLALVLFFMARLVDDRRRADAAGLGLALGSALFGYPPAATFPVIVIVGCVSTATVTALARRRRGGSSSARVGDVGRLASWVVGGWFVAAAPLLGFFVGAPDELLGRTRMVTAHLGEASVPERLAWIPRGVLYPVIEQPRPLDGHFFRQAGPFLGWAMAMLVLAGLGAWAHLVLGGLRSREPRRRVEILVVAWLVLGVGASQTVGMASQRLVGAVGLWALAAGSGVAAVASLGQRVVESARSTRRWPVSIAVSVSVSVVIVVAIGIGGATYWFDDDRQIVTYGEVRSATAYDLGIRVAARDPAVTRVMVAGEGVISYEGFGNFQLLAPDPDGSIVDLPAFDVEGSGEVGVPVLEPGDVLVLSVARPEAERCAVLARYPDAGVQEARARDGSVLYTTFRVSGAGLPEGRSPAGTNLATVVPVSC